ncbi:MAG: hypothetical protein K9J21_06890 [Bacteroidales bacterium]|nr:hypothetical protein [Bacteroidales bacterium]
MDKLRTNFTGGLPAVQEIFKFMQDANLASFESIVKALNYSDPGFILYGCDYTDNGTNFTINSGAIVLNGEVLLVDSHNVSKTTNYRYTWCVEETDDPDGAMQFYDGSTNSVFAKRRGKVQAWLAPIGTYMDLGSEPRMTDLINDFLPSNLVQASVPDWYSLSYANGWDSYANSSHVQALYTKLFNGIVHLEGYVSPGSATGAIVAQLPTGYRPASYVRFVTPEYGKLVSIDKSGNISINLYDTGDTRYYFNIQFATDLSNLVIWRT